MNDQESSSPKPTEADLGATMADPSAAGQACRPDSKAADRSEPGPLESTRAIVVGAADIVGAPGGTVVGSIEVDGGKDDRATEEKTATLEPRGPLSLDDPETPASKGRRARPTIPGYEILGELGRGGMGVVYLGRQIMLNRPCALKMILAGAHANAVTSRRFLAEARAVARFRHPNVVQIHHIGEAEGLPFLELEYMEGGSLDRALDGTPWTVDHAATLLEALTRGVSAAHRLEIVHRDLKPANVLLASDGTPKIADFGLAKSLRQPGGLTKTDSILGSPSYMAPEQAEGHARRVGPSADVYSLGAIFYELLTGRPPFVGATVLETLDQVKEAEPVPPRRLVPGLSRDAETICLKCLEKAPGRRYATAEALGEDLRRFLGGEPIEARPIRPWERVAKWARRRPALAASFVAVHVLLVALLGLGIWSYAEIRRSYTEINRSYGEVNGALAIAKTEREKAEELARTEALATERAEQQAAIARERAETLRRQDVIGRVNLALRESLDNNVARALELLDGCPEDLRGWEWEYVRRQCRLDLHSFLDAAPSVNAVAFSPDGRFLATGSGDFSSPIGQISGDVVVRDAATGEEVFAFRGLPQGVRAVAFSPDGRCLAFGHAKDLIVRELPGGRERFRRTWPGPSGVSALAFSPDGRSLLVGSGLVGSATYHGDARLLDAETGDELGEVLPGGEGAVWGVAFSPDGGQCALTMKGRVLVLDTESREMVHDLRAHSGFVYGVAFSPDGRFFASAGLDRTVRLHDRVSGTLVRTLVGHEGFVRALAFSPDSRLLVSGAEDKTLKLWSVDSDRELATLHGHTHFVQSVAFNADGYRVASAGLNGEVKIWFATPERQLSYPFHDGWVYSLAFSPEGRRVASAAIQGNRDPRVALWDPATGEAELFLPNGTTRALAFGPDGDRLAVGGDSMGIWDLRGRARSLPIDTGSTVSAVAISPDGRRLASAGYNDQAVRIWGATTGQLLHEFQEVGPKIAALAFSPDGRFLAAASAAPHFLVGSVPPAVVRVWDAESGSEVHRLEGHIQGVGGLAFFPDGRRLVSVGGVSLGGAAEIKVWDLTTGSLLRDLGGHTDVVTAVAISPDGHRLATGSDDRTIKLWDSATFEEVFTLRGHQAGVVALAFSPDGRRLVSGSIDRTAKVWDLDAPSLETLYRREAVAVARPLFDRLLDPEQVAEAIRVDSALSEPVRLAALEIAGRLRVDAPSLMRRAQEHADRGDWELAAADVEDAIELSPRADTDPGGLRFRKAAEYHARSGAWGRAADVLGQGLAYAHEPVGELRHSQILSLLKARDRDGSRRAIAELLDQARRVTDPAEAHRLAWFCVLVSGPLPDPETVARLASMAIEGGPEESRAAASTTIGAALYRDGRLEAAIERLRANIRASESGGSIEDQIFLAMALHRSGQLEDARSCLKEVRPVDPGSPEGFSWKEVEFGLLWEEAEALILGHPSDFP